MRCDVRLLVRQEDFVGEGLAALVKALPYPKVGVLPAGGAVEVRVDGVRRDCLGALEGLERQLVERGVPFDRYLDCEASGAVAVRYFRPGTGGSEEVDMEVELEGGAGPAVPVRALVEALEQDAGDLRERVAALVRQAGPRPLDAPEER